MSIQAIAWDFISFYTIDLVWLNGGPNWVGIIGLGAVALYVLYRTGVLK